MKYNVFKIDDQDTWPTLNCPILVWRKNYEYPMIYQWDPIEHCFLNDYDTYYPNKCIYSYIGYRPYVVKETNPIQCACHDWRCPSYDDGYCLQDEECKYQKEILECMMGLKPIYKKY